MADPLADLSSKGVSIWLDDLSRPRLTTGSLAGLVAHDHVTGVTTNPTIFAKAIAGSEAYAEQIRDLWARGALVGDALRAMTAFDVRWACDVLRPVYDATDGVDGRVSIEVDARVPYFYTDQYDLGMEYSGYVEPGGYDQVVFRGDKDRREFVVFWLSSGRVLAGMNVNVWDVNDAVQDLVRGGQVVDPARLADASVPLDQAAG